MQERPNVVFVMADQHRWDFMGYERNGLTHTPHLDEWGRSGAIFRRAYCPAPLCCPSRQAIMSGRHAVNSGCFTNLHELAPGSPTFVARLRAAGYRTAAIGKTHMEIHAYDSDLTSEAHREFMDSLGFDDICEISGNGMLRTGIRCAYSEFLRECGKFEEVLEFYGSWPYFMDNRPGLHGFQPLEWPLAPECQETEFVGRQAVAWLDSRPQDKPFFLHVGFAAPHSPIEPAPKYMDLYRNAPESSAWGTQEDPPWLADGRRGYRAMISQIDHWVGEIREALARRGTLERTFFVYTADHGEMAGDHGLYGKTSFFEGSARVPLVVAGPGILPGLDTEAMAEILDLGKTVCDLCGVEPHEMDQGRSLAPLLHGETESHRDTVYCEMGCDRMLFDGRYKLMWGDPNSDKRRLGKLHLDKPVNIPPSPPMLYDLAEDPCETEDIFPRPENAALVRQMLERLLVRQNENVQPRSNKSRGEYKPPQVSGDRSGSPAIGPG